MMFASIDHRDVPWRAGQKVKTISTEDAHYTIVMRESFQRNPTNPILAEFRKYAKDHGDTAWLAAHWTRNEYTWSEMCLRDGVLPDEPLGTPEQERHAHRVLTRLASLTNDKES